MRRAALIVTLVSVGIWAIIAIFALLGGGFGDTQWKILASSMLVTAAAAVAMASAVPLHAGRLGAIPWIGIGASVVGFGMVILGLWAETSWDGAAKIAGSLVVAAVAVGAIGLIDGARVRSGHRWVVMASQGLVALAAAMVISAIWGEFGNSLFWRLTGVVLVLTAAAVVSVPILHRMADIPAGERDDARRVSACPFCAAAVDGPLASQITCPACGNHFRVIG
ncbi:MAG: hypothetical protein MUP76_10500 [Acidimicrobiia bacterium]|nr:hypothetical protein [Acidimicrobiia bacterium]